MKRLQSLSAKLYLKGHGLVNYNGSTPTLEQNNRFYHILKHDGVINDNCSFAKEHVYNVNGNLIIKKIIDSNLLRKVSIGDELEPIAKIISENSSLKLKFLSKLNMIARGWMYSLEKEKKINEEKEVPKKTKTDSKTSTLVEEEKKEKGIIIKRKSGVMITDAEQICGAITSMILKTKDGKKDKNSIFYKESCGEIHYMSEIKFDVKQLQLISIDDNYERMAIFEKEVNEYILNLNKQGYKATKGNYSTTHENLVGEQAIILEDKAVYDMIRIVIEKILNIDIQRAGAYARTKKFVLILDEKEEEIKTIEDFDKLKLNFGCDFKEIK